MNTPLGPVGLPPTPPSPTPEPSAWQSVGKTLGRMFSAIISLPFLLISLALKIASFASERLLGSTPQTPSPSTLNATVSKETVPPELTEVFQETLEQERSIKKEETITPKSSSPIKPETDSKQISSDSEIIESDEEIELEPEQNEKELEKREVEVSPNSEAVTVTPAKEQTALAKSVINVPDDGNCLFYALGVGLRKKYNHLPEIQEKLQWDVKPELLTGDLFKADKLLEAPGITLREQAAKYLEAHQNDEDGEVMLALMEGIFSHLEVVQKKIQEEEAVIPFLEEDIEQLKKMVQTPNVKKQIEDKQAHLAIVKESVEYQRANLPKEEDLQGYIEITKKDHIYCGAAQVFALSKEYQIPIRVLYNYGKGDQHEQIFNEQAGKDKPVLTVAHVNGNHFEFVDD